MNEIQKSFLMPYNLKGEILIQDRQSFKNPGWGLFRGRIKEDEKPIEGVIREVAEE